MSGGRGCSIASPIPRTVFEDHVEMIANFSGEEYDYEKNSLPAGGVLLRWKDSGRVEVYRNAHSEP